MKKMEEDIFDRIMHLSIFRVFEPFYIKHKEVLLYLLFGGLSFLLNFALFALFTEVFKISALISNAISWVICVLFQFFTNRKWVFDGSVNTREDFIKQIASFFGGRLFTLIVEEAMIIVFITWLGFNAMAVKLVAQIIVIVLNYFISKLIVFKK